MAASDSAPAPVVTCSWELSSDTYRISSDEPPQFSLTLVSHHTTPITVSLPETRPSWMRERASLRVIDVATGKETKQPRQTYCKFGLPTRFKYPLHEQFFYELPPGQPVTLSAPFGPDHPSHFESLERSGGANGVVGLPPGRYMIELSNRYTHWSHIGWWNYGTREEVLQAIRADESGKTTEQIYWDKGPQPRIELDASSFKPIMFEIVE